MRTIQPTVQSLPPEHVAPSAELQISIATPRRIASLRASAKEVTSSFACAAARLFCTKLVKAGTPTTSKIARDGDGNHELEQREARCTSTRSEGRAAVCSALPYDAPNRPHVLPSVWLVSVLRSLWITQPPEFDERHRLQDGSYWRERSGAVIQRTKHFNDDERRECDNERRAFDDERHV